MYSYVFKHTRCNWLFAGKETDPVIKTNLKMRLTFSGNNMYRHQEIFVFHHPRPKRSRRVQLKIMIGLLKFRVSGGKLVVLLHALK